MDMQKTDVPIFKSALLSQTNHGFFTRVGGVSTGDFASLNITLRDADSVLPGRDATENVLENRRIAMAALGLEDTKSLFVYQVHSPDAVLADLDTWDFINPPAADAMVTKDPRVTLCIQTADCTPVLFADEKNKVIGAAHAGWRGAFAGVVENTVKLMCAQGAEAQHIKASIGPCVAQSSYEVGEDFQAAFLQRHPDAEQFFRDIHGQPHFDVSGFVASRLKSVGIHQIDNINQDTLTQPQLFFSCRWANKHGNKVFGGNLSAISLKGNL
jgi:YfiH family protein